MGRTMPERAISSHRLSLEGVHPQMAKADLKKLEPEDLRVALGAAIMRARMRIGWSQGETAGYLAKALRRDDFDQAQLSRWEKGTERPQFDALFAIPALRWPLIACIAEIDEGVEVVEEIRRRR